MSRPRGTQALGVHHSVSLAKLNCQTVVFWGPEHGGREAKWLDTDNRWMDPWYKGLPRAPDIRAIKLNSDVLSPAALFYKFLYARFNHIYHSAILLMPESAVHSGWTEISGGWI